MVTLTFAICLVICITCFFLFRKHNEYDGFFFLGIVEKYLDNTKEIDNLRSQQFDIKGKKWDLYFGS